MGLPSFSLADVSRIFNIQEDQYQEVIPMPVTIAANSNSLGQAFVSGMGDFHCQRILGRFDTLNNNSGIVDDGVCYLSGKLTDGSNQRQLFGDYVPLEIFLSPGRTRSPLATNNLSTAAASNSLFYPFMFDYVFSMNSYINMDIKNSSTQALACTLLFVGRRLRQRTTSGQK